MEDVIYEDSDHEEVLFRSLSKKRLFLEPDEDKLWAVREIVWLEAIRERTVRWAEKGLNSESLDSWEEYKRKQEVSEEDEEEEDM